MVLTRRIPLLLLSHLIAISLGAHAIRPLTDVRYEAMARESGVVLSDGSGFVVISGNHVFRIDSSGQVIDPAARPIRLPSTYSYMPPVGIWTGSSYLLVWQTYSTERVSSGETVQPRVPRNGRRS